MGIERQVSVNETGKIKGGFFDPGEYGKDNYWTGEKMVEQMARIALPIYNYVFPDCGGFFASDNASNNCAFTPDTLVAAKMNIMPRGKQPLLHDGWNHRSNQPQSMVFIVTIVQMRNCVER
jgi:hypothetical protein